MEWIIGAMCALWVTEKIVDWRRDRARAQHMGTQPICGCKHHHAFHNPSTGHCKEKSRFRTGTDRNGYGIYTLIDCPCQQYSGPMPQIDYRIIGELQGSPAPSSTDPKE